VTALLLDTHVVIWWIFANPKVRPSWVEAIVDPENSVALSAASVWEVEIKKRRGKLDFPLDLVDLASAHGFDLLPMTASDARLAGSLDWEHNDPFDRMLAAQSLEHGLTVVTDDGALAAAPGIRALR
jgi:PIN domain nuclease of toxin-antitoxin system